MAAATNTAVNQGGSAGISTPTPHISNSGIARESSACAATMAITPTLIGKHTVSPYANTFVMPLLFAMTSRRFLKNAFNPNIY